MAASVGRITVGEIMVSCCSWEMLRTDSYTCGIAEINAGAVGTLGFVYRDKK